MASCPCSLCNRKWPPLRCCRLKAHRLSPFTQPAILESEICESAAAAARTETKQRGGDTGAQGEIVLSGGYGERGGKDGRGGRRVITRRGPGPPSPTWCPGRGDERRARRPYRVRG
ncbi:hypothetical protein NHX12_026776 [Muraenolepis orangiensis]|uniref:Uncharacterized protein n=1 Tax=Muraenolepis orangiensis TaxID=630683 RepID=A0A9Q0EH67_9TELE|nr:hypothetical protein NHX12_026776 [Muraenolepis orangiensis]